ncbi:UV endonuclease [Vibrio phage vB_pir03]|nr:UV endonuclease [Vibrio phage vB_pir03]
MSTPFKVGIACQFTEWRDTKDGLGTTWVQRADTKVGTIKVKYIKDLPEEAQYDKLYCKLVENLDALEAQCTTICLYPETACMLRLSSDLFPLIDHPDYMHLYDTGTIDELLTKRLAKIGDLFKVHNVRLSVHPSQFITLFSDKDHVVDSAIRHINKWINIFILLGYNPSEHDVVICMHTNGQSFKFPDRAKHLIPWIALENDEKAAGFDKTLKICQDNGIRMILDVHHYRCEKKAHIGLNSDEFYAVLETWKDKGRPKMHVSSPRGTENYKELCMHADFISTEDLEQYWEFAYKFDIMVEAKAKSVAAGKVHRFLYEKIIGIK